MKSRYEQNEKKRRLERRERKRGIIIKMIIVLVIILVLLAIWGKFCEPNILAVNDFKLENEKIPESFNGSKIVHFSDLHYGLLDEKRLKKLVNQINDLKPDIVVFTGDLIEEGYSLSDNDTKTLIKYLSKINSKLGKYAILGNHDIKNENFDNIMYDSAFRVLKNNYDTIYNEKNEPILIYGFDDSLNGKPNPKGLKDKSINSINYRIALIHEPDYINEFIYDYDISLVLAGHSHGGQVKIPGIRPLFLPEGCKKYYKSYYEVNNTPLYISNGIGGSMLDFRLFSMPSINVYRLYTK